MPGTSPLLHAPSLAQHRFAAFMALWYAGSLAWLVFKWWDGGKPTALVMNIVGPFGYELGSRYLSLFPARFFAGWALMFLPGAVAAHDYSPMPREQVALRRRIIGCGAPAVVGLSLFFLIATMSYLMG